MPRINVLYTDEALTDDVLEAIKDPVRELIAEAISVPSAKVTIAPESIEWDPRMLHDQADYDDKIVMEIFTSGYIERKTKLTSAVISKLKANIQKVGKFKSGLRLKIRYTDPDDINV